jgi:hypothetical protein
VPLPSPSRCALTLALVLASTAAPAQERPPEEELFGGPAEPEKARESAPHERGSGVSEAEPSTSKSSKPAAASAASQSAAGAPAGLESEPGVEDRLLQVLGRTENPLSIGGVLYLRSNVSAREHAPPSQWTYSVPTLTDVYLDARPTERVRGFVLGRMQFDPTISSGGTTSPVAGLTTGAPPSNPQVLLDQLWLRFDAARRAFFTVGRQHVKWGVGRFWSPTDYLHAVKRDPLAVFDERTGTTMARVDLPWEERGWNLSAMAIFEPLVTRATSPFLTSASGTSQVTDGSGGSGSNALGTVGAGARAEVVLGSWELGIDGVVQRGIRPRFGVDASGGIWELDLRGELALRTSSDVPLYRGGVASFSTFEPRDRWIQAVGGVEWSHKYSDEDLFTVGLEYYYNSNGYTDTAVYPVLLAANAFTPFYLGRHYLGAYLSLPRPGSWDLHTITLSTLWNLSDESGVARLDWTVTLLTYLQLELYAQGHLGALGGEFRLQVDVPPQTIGDRTTPAIFIGAPVVDAGVALRINL